MDVNKMKKALEVLAANYQPKRSETSRLGDVLDRVESTLAAGVSHAQVVEVLNQQGYKMTLKSFQSALYRLRKRRLKAS